MKFLFPTTLIVVLLCVTGTMVAKVQPASLPKKKTFSFLIPKTKKPKASTPETTTAPGIEATQEQKLAVVAAIKSMQQIIDETTDKNNKAKFGIGCMVDTIKKQATYSNHPDKHLFEKDLPIGEQLLQIQDNDLKQATVLAKQLTPETQKFLREALEKRYSVFSRLGALKDFVTTRTVPTA